MATLVSCASGNMTDGTFPSVQCNVAGTHYITTADIALDGATTFTIAGWVKKQTGTNIAIVGSKGTSTTNQFYLAFENGRVRCNVSNTANTYGDYTMSNDTSWHFFAMVYNGAGSTNADKLKLYVDGTEQTLTYTGTIPATAGTNSSTFDIARYYPSGAATYGDQFCSHITVHSTALSGSDISTLYNGGSGVKDASIVGTLLHGWLLNEGSGTLAYDYAPSANNTLVSRVDGSLTGAVWDLTTGVVTSGTACFAQATLINTDSEASSYTVTLTPTNLSTFTASGVVMQGVNLHIATVSVAPTGTFSVVLRNVTDSVDERTVTINVSDLPNNAATGATRLWAFFKFSSNYTGVAGKTYAIRVSSTSSPQISLYGTASGATSVSAYYTTNTKQIPMVSDRLLICGEYTGQGTGSNHVIVTNDFTPKTYGQASTTVSNHIAARGRLQIANVANKRHFFRQKGEVWFDGGGGIEAITSPESTCYNTWDFDIATNVDGGFICKTAAAGGDTGAYEIPSFKTKLMADASAGATSLTVGSTAGWKTGDELAIGSSTRTSSHHEKRTIASVDSATTVTLTSGLTNAHSGTSPTNTEVFHLTRNFKIGGESSSLQAFLDVTQYARTFTWRGVEFYNMGSATTSKRGIDAKTGYSTYECNFIGCSFRDFVVASSCINVSGASHDRIKFQDCVAYNFPTNIGLFGATTGTNNYIINCGFMGTSSGVGLVFSDAGWIFQGDSVLTSTGSNGVAINEAGGRLAQSSGTFRIGNTSAMGLTITNSARDGVLPTISAWRNSGVGINLASVFNLKIPLGEMFGNTTDNIAMAGSCADIDFTGGSMNGDSTFSTTNGFRNSNAGVFDNIRFDNVDFSTSSGILTAHTNDINLGATGSFSIILNNCKMGASTELSGPANMSATSIIASQNHDQTAGNHKYWRSNGIGTSDTTLYKTASPSERMTPGATIIKSLTGSKKCTIAASGTRTIGVWVRKSNTTAGDSATYNGSEVRLILKANPSLGSSFNDDIVCASSTSAANGAWEELTYTTPTATNAGALEFYLDGDGTTGWFNVDDWSVS